MTRRYYIDGFQEKSATLDTSESHHFLHVMRGKPGEQIEVFDGQGRAFHATVTSADRKTVHLELLDPIEVNRELNCELVMAVAMPKGDRQKYLVEKLVEFGVTTLIPITTQQSVNKVTDSLIQKLKRTVVESSKQCGRNVLMKIEPLTKLDQFLESISQLDSQSNLNWIAHPAIHKDSPSQNPITTFYTENQSNSVKRVTAIVGPEGGFTTEEVKSAMEFGFDSIDLGNRILRTESAATSIAAIVSASQS